MSRIVVSAAVGLCYLSLSFGAIASAAAAEESTSKQSLAVLGIVAGRNTEQGVALALALQRALDTSIEWTCPPNPESLGNLMQSAKCPETPDADCLSRIAEETTLKRFVWGTLKLAKGHITANLELYDGLRTGTTTKLDYSAKMTDTFDEDLLRLASIALGRILGPLHFPVVVSSRERMGEIFIDEVSVGKLHDGMARLSATVGDHRVRLVLPDATAVARSFRVRVEHVTTVRLDFIDVPET